MDDVSRARPSTTTSTSSDAPPRRECWAWLCVHACSHAGLAALVVAYTLLGAVLFELVEGGAVAVATPSTRSSTATSAATTGDRRVGGVATAVQKSREECLRELWTITERLNVLYERNWTRLVHEQLRKFELNVMSATQLAGGNALQDLQDSSVTHQHQQQWSFGGALLYSVTVITTIGYGNLSPRTSLGKILTMIYALFGVPLMLLCLSSLGQVLARGVHYVYTRATCQNTRNSSTHTVETSHSSGRISGTSKERCRVDRKEYKYQMVTNSPARSSCASTHDSSVIQLATPHKTLPPPPPPLSTPRKSALATVNSSHTRARCRLLSATPPPPHPPQDPDDPDETDDTESGNFPHDTPSRIPLIWRDDSKTLTTPSSPSSQSTNQQVSVPVAIVLVVLTAYLCLGAFFFASWENWSYLDATYFCFITLSTIGFGDLIPGKTFPSGEEYGHLQLVLCSVYLVIGLVLVAMSFSLIHDEVMSKCRQVARALGVHTH